MNHAILELKPHEKKKASTLFIPIYEKVEVCGYILNRNGYFQIKIHALQERLRSRASHLDNINKQIKHQS